MRRCAVERFGAETDHGYTGGDWMTVHTSSKLKQATDYAVTDTMGSPACSAASSTQDPYPTRLPKPLDTLWLKRREGVVRGSAQEGPLTQEQLNEFERKGVLFALNCSVGDELDAHCEQLSELLQRKAFRGPDMSNHEAENQEIRTMGSPACSAASSTQD